jgi:hypothetical protein
VAERGITVSYESIRLWCIKFGPEYTRRLRRRHQGFGDTFYIDEVTVSYSLNSVVPFTTKQRNGPFPGPFICLSALEI